MAVVDLKTDDGLRLVAEDWGDPNAPTALLLGGTGVERQLFGIQIAGLADRYHVVAFDGRDVGESDRAPGEYDTMVLARDALAVLDAFEVERAHVSGFSLGGCVGLQLGVRHADRVASLATASCWARVDGHLRAQFQYWIDLMEAAGWNMVFRLMAFSAFSNETIEMLGDSIYDIGAQMAESFDEGAFRRQVGADASHSLTDAELGTITAPFLSLWGTEDLLVPRKHAEQLAAAVPGAEIAPLEGVSHSVTVDHGERYADALRGWLERHA